MKKALSPFLVFCLLILTLSIHAQSLQNIELEDCRSIIEAQDGVINYIISDVPLFSVEINGERFTSNSENHLAALPQPCQFKLGGLIAEVRDTIISQAGISIVLKLSNPNPTDTFSIKNLVPSGVDKPSVYLTGLGEHPLSRSHLFIKGKEPVNVILPDNAWEMGFACLDLDGDNGLCALARRIDNHPTRAQRKRFETILAPGGYVSYQLFFDLYQGAWQEGLRLMFQDRYLYDLVDFNESLYQRKDLEWIRHCYAIHLLMAWDSDFYDPDRQTYTLINFLKENQKLFGGSDIIGIWPNWPMLGLDQRNQWDLYRQLPGGLEKLKNLAMLSRQLGTKFFISYNPWDESTRWEDHHKGMSDMISSITADGVVLDTEGKSNKTHQEAADAVREGVIMYSEGMAVPADMPGILAGRVHNALYYQPMLNLNKFIRPDFSIFRVAELYREPIRREYALSFWNGYGTEINQFRPGRPDWIKEDYRFWGRTLRILRENNSNFTNGIYTPLVPTEIDGIYVNEWKTPHKTIYTLFSLIPKGYQGSLFKIERQKGHVVDLWNHKMIEPQEVNDSQWNIPVDISSFNQKYSGSNNEGAVGAIGIFPVILNVELTGSHLYYEAGMGDSIHIWAGIPSYEDTAVIIESGKGLINLWQVFGSYQGKFVVQLFDRDQLLLDEVVVESKLGEARLISHFDSSTSSIPGSEMVLIPAGPFNMRVTFGDNFIPHPKSYPTGTLSMDSFYIDQFPVTNRLFKIFLDESRYEPEDSNNFLNHWENGEIPSGQENFPVIYVSYKDAKAYANWTGKRLPTEIEWQYAAQTSDQRDWPWTSDKVIRTKSKITETLTVSQLQVDSSLCNPGNGELYPVGSYPAGSNPYGLQDLVGSVWQLTNDVYESGGYQFIILKGGSYYLPASSWWYVEGGPRELTYSQKLMRVSPGFERNATTGFRCMKDIK